MTTRQHERRFLFATTVVAMLALAGCAAPTTPTTPTPATGPAPPVDAGPSVAGEVDSIREHYDDTEGSPLRLGLITPETRFGLDPGPVEFTFMLYHGPSKTAVMDATMTLAARNTDTSATADVTMPPSHGNKGLFSAAATLDAPGAWTVDVAGSRASGGSFAFTFDLGVAAPDDGEEEATTTTPPDEETEKPPPFLGFNNSQEALVAPGHWFEATAGEAAYNLKVLRPLDLHDRPTNVNELAFMVTDSSRTVPIEDLSVALKLKYDESNVFEPSGIHRPSYKTHGIYTGAMNFHITGGWEVQVNVSDGAAVFAPAMTVTDRRDPTNDASTYDEDYERWRQGNLTRAPSGGDP